MKYILSIIMYIMFLGNVSGEVQHVSIGTIAPSYRYEDLVLTIVSPENRKCV